MNYTASIAWAAFGLLIAGCSKTDSHAVAAPSAASSASIKKTTSSSPCQLSDTELKTCTEKDGKDKWVCHIYVFNAEPRPVVVPFNLITPMPEQAKDLKIVWHLIDPYDELEFESNEDGPKELKKNKEFDDLGSVNRMDDAASSAKGTKYRMTYKNKDKGAGHKYTIQFRDKKGKTFACDPNIVNSGV